MIATGFDQIEYDKCLNDPTYFFKKYCTVTTKIKIEVKRETLEGSEFEEIANIFLKYFTEDEKHRIYYSEHIRLIERVTHDDGDVSFVLSFNGSRYDVTKSSIDLEQVLPLLRREKIEKLCQIKLY